MKLEPSGSPFASLVTFSKFLSTICPVDLWDELGDETNGLLILPWSAVRDF